MDILPEHAKDNAQITSGTSGNANIVSTTVKGCNSVRKGSSSFGRRFKGSSTIERRFSVVDKGSNKGSIVFRCGKGDVGTSFSQHPT